MRVMRAMGKNSLANVVRRVSPSPAPTLNPPCTALYTTLYTTSIPSHSGAGRSGECPMNANKRRAATQAPALHNRMILSNKTILRRGPDQRRSGPRLPAKLFCSVSLLWRQRMGFCIGAYSRPESEARSIHASRPQGTPGRDHSRFIAAGNDLGSSSPSRREAKNDKSDADQARCGRSPSRLPSRSERPRQRAVEHGLGPEGRLDKFVPGRR